MSIDPETVSPRPDQADDFVRHQSSRRSHLVGGIAAAVVAVVLGGIGGIRAWSGDTNRPPTEPGAAATVSATGILRGVGGPAGVGPRGLSGTVVFLNRGAKVGSARTDSDGRFTIRVPAGRYVVIGTSPQYNDGAGTCRARSAVTVAAGGPVPPEIDVDCVER